MHTRKNISGHTTADEIIYIDGLGKFRENRNHSPILTTRLELLRGYKESMKLRYNWGSIDPEKIAEAVDKAIAAESQREKELEKYFS